MSGSHGTRKQSQLSPVIRAVKLSLRRRDQSIRPHPPPLEAADAHSIPRPSGPGVGASQGPVIVGAFIPHLQLVHNKVQIRERSHKRSREFRNRVSPHCGSFAVDGQRPIGRIKSSHTVPIPAAPCRCIAQCKFPHLAQVCFHRPNGINFNQATTLHARQTATPPVPVSRLLLPLSLPELPLRCRQFFPCLIILSDSFSVGFGGHR